MNPRRLRALDPKSAARYEIARHPLGRWEVLPHQRQEDRSDRDRLVQAPDRRRVPPPGTAALEFASDLRGDVGEPASIRPFAPVVLVDGEPAATGWGTAEIDLAPGPHLVEVQSGASAGYWPVAIPDQRIARLGSFVPQRLEPVDGAGAFLRQFALVPTGSVPRGLGRPRMERTRPSVKRYA